MKKAYQATENQTDKAIFKAAKIFGKSFDEVESVYYDPIKQCPTPLRPAYCKAHEIARKYEKSNKKTILLAAAMVA